MRYASTILYVPDVAAAVTCTEGAFGLQQAFADPGGTYAALGGEGGVLAFASHDQAAQGVGDEGRAAPAGFEVWIEADDVPAAVQRALEAGAQLVHEPVEKPSGPDRRLRARSQRHARQSWASRWADGAQSTKRSHLQVRGVEPAAE